MLEMPWIVRSQEHILLTDHLIKTLEDVKVDQTTGETISYSFTVLTHYIKNKNKPLLIVQMQ